MAFKKGQSGNPRGRKKGVPNKRTDLMNAIKYVQGTKGPDGKKRKKLLVHAIEQAYVDNVVLVAVLRKLVPDQKTLEVSGAVDVTHELSTALKANLKQVYSRNDTKQIRGPRLLQSDSQKG